MVFQKNSSGGNWPNVGPKIMHAHNPGFTSRISLKFATIKAKSHFKVILVVFLKKIIFRAIGTFWTQKCYTVLL